MQITNIPISEKHALTVLEAAEYFNMGYKKLRKLAAENLGKFAVISGNRYLIIRKKFEEFMERSSEV